MSLIHNSFQFNEHLWVPKCHMLKDDFDHVIVLQEPVCTKTFCPTLASQEMLRMLYSSSQISSVTCHNFHFRISSLIWHIRGYKKFCNRETQLFTYLVNKQNFLPWTFKTPSHLFLIYLDPHEQIWLHSVQPPILPYPPLPSCSSTWSRWRLTCFFGTAPAKHCWGKVHSGVNRLYC